MKLHHYDIDGQARFVTFCTHRFIPLLTNDLFRSEVIEAIERARRSRCFRLIGYVIMPEHVHLVLIPHPKDQLGTIVGEIKYIAAGRILEHLKKSNSPLLARLHVSRNGKNYAVLWQRRCYDHNCRTEREMWAKVDYCHRNPVRRGLVASAERYIWSSARWYCAHGRVLLALDELVRES